TYDAIGGTAGTPPDNYTIDHNRVRLGTGDADFEAARTALQKWKQVRLSWTRVWPDDTPIREGSVIALLARSCGLWWLNACKIVYTVDELSPNRKFGFAYGTLPAHAGSGEERFQLEMDDKGVVWYDILAFSRPSSVAARLAYLIFRASQRRFSVESGKEMRRIVELAQ
ncbi:MAG: DUF1990 domain-containing protein, partial [Planctomycetota bacterium]